MHREWAGLIAFVLAVGVALTMVIALLSVMLTSEPISSEKASLLSTMAGAAIGVIGTYIGAHGRHGTRAGDLEPEERQVGEHEPTDVPGP